MDKRNSGITESLNYREWKCFDMARAIGIQQGSSATV